MSDFVGRLDESSMLVLLTGVAWTCWFWITGSFVVDCIRLLARRPLRSRRRFSARLAVWTLMISPTVVLSVASPGHASVETLETTRNDFDSRSIPVSHVLVSALLVWGILVRLRSRRRRILREDEDLSESGVLEWESAVVRCADELALVRIELAMRSLMALAAASFRMLVVRSDGSVLVEFRQDRTPRAPWIRHTQRIWKLDGTVGVDSLSEIAAAYTGPLPVVVPVGTTAGGEVWINLQEVQVFGVHGDDESADFVWSGLCQTLALSPLTEHVSLISSEEIRLRGRREITIADEQRVLRIAEGLHTTELPAVVLTRHRLTVSSSAINVHRDQVRSGEFGLAGMSGHWRLEPTGTPIEPIRCTEADLEVIDRLVETPSLDESATTRAAASSPPIPLDYRFIASVLGVPHVRHIDGRPVSFERRRSEELVIWLAIHPDRQRRRLARDEIWNIAIKDSTFSNVVSDARRSLAVLESPPDRNDWIEVTLTDELPLHPLVISDAQIFARCFEHARRWPEEQGRQTLEFALGLVSGPPFGGANFLWRDATGLGSEFARMVVQAALLLADMYADSSADDRDVPQNSTFGSWMEGVYWATAKGLLAVPGHEELVIRRMDLHARLGDHAALLAEWQGYCRVLASDDWGDIEPSPKMVAAWRRLTRSAEIVNSIVEGSVAL